ncbi:hypothetical protein ACSDIA_003438 [Cronobacter turicensis]|nr:hypothetical protein [Cronobacter turicensis]EKM0532852.1 hypothetical protein [Cronobacter turicensis]ELQ6108003.1 hypothetical protein [Cronobacter turicensis]ELY4303420.1 hypothetical protein [Cronobacter turicensis]ELY5932623.1 hypothetical protein [Cronobacter turicensis]
MHYLLELICDILWYWPSRNPPAEGRNAIPSLKHKPLFRMPAGDPLKKDEQKKNPE